MKGESSSRAGVHAIRVCPVSPALAETQPQSFPRAVPPVKPGRLSGAPGFSSGGCSVSSPRTLPSGSLCPSDFSPGEGQGQGRPAEQAGGVPHPEAQNCSAPAPSKRPPQVLSSKEPASARRSRFANENKTTWAARGPGCTERVSPRARKEGWGPKGLRYWVGTQTGPPGWVWRAEIYFLGSE